MSYPGLYKLQNCKKCKKGRMTAIAKNGYYNSHAVGDLKCNRCGYMIINKWSSSPQWY